MWRKKKWARMQWNASIKSEFFCNACGYLFLISKKSMYGKCDWNSCIHCWAFASCACIFSHFWLMKLPKSRENLIRKLLDFSDFDHTNWFDWNINEAIFLHVIYLFEFRFLFCRFFFSLLLLLWFDETNWIAVANDRRTVQSQCARS